MSRSDRLYFWRYCNSKLDPSQSIEKASKIGWILKSLWIIGVEKSSFDKAWDLFRKQKDTVLSFTDCTTISIMQENYIEKIATFERRF